MIKIGLLILGGILGLGLGLELLLRLGLGLGNPPLYVADETMGYRLAPHQRLRRFGNRIDINGYSLRNGPIAPQPDPGTLRLLLLGDSIVNGGWWTDQAQILSARLAQDLATHLPQPPEVLNASANSWGPRNQLAYVQRFGLLGAQGLVWVLNTDDLFGGEPSSLGVGRDRNYPDRRPPAALWELYRRYLRPLPLDPLLRDRPPETGDVVGKNLAALTQLHHMTQTAGIPLVLALTPLRRELAQESGPRPYELEARQRLIQWVDSSGVPFVDLLPRFNGEPDPLILYRDHIHLSPQGDRLLSQTLAHQVALILP